MGKAWRIRPNVPEMSLLGLLEELYPGEWKFTGDFSFVINGKNPDFVNCNGQKKVIELFGDYWHRGEDPKDRAAIFAPFGYSTLVIWERELKDMEKVAKRIHKFVKEKTANVGQRVFGG
jgi:very-short-patch-repair endonuclease